MLEKKYFYFFIIIFLFFNTSTALSQTQFPTNKCEIKNVRQGIYADKVRIVLDLTSSANYNILVSEDKKMVVVEVKNCPFNVGLNSPVLVSDKIVNKIFLFSLKEKNFTLSRLQIYLKYPLPSTSFVLQNPYRISIDFNKIFTETEYFKITSGLFYKKVRQGTKNGIILYYLVEISDLNKYKLLPVITPPKTKQIISEIANQNNSLVAINGGYFSKSDALPLGLIFINNKIISSEIFKRTNLMLNTENKYEIGYPKIKITAQSKNLNLNINAVNRERKENEIILYNSYFGTNTNTNNWGLEIIVENGVVKDKTIGNSNIPENGFVISCYKTQCGDKNALNVGDELNLKIEITDEENIPLNFSLSAGPLLLKNGEISITGKEENFKSDITSGRAPRTALGISQKGEIFLLVVDGRNENISIGATLEETAEILKNAGAFWGMNFDGGGSSTLIVNNQVINNPSDGQERKVVSALILIEKL